MTDAAVVMQGTLELLILKALSLAPMHGWGITNRIKQLSRKLSRDSCLIRWGITNRIKQLSRESFRVGQGSLYPALHRYEQRGWVSSYWRTTEHNRVAQYYDLTAAGRRALSDEIARWRSYTGAMDRVIEAR